MAAIQRILKERGVEFEIPKKKQRLEVVTDEAHRSEILDKIIMRLPAPYTLQETILEVLRRFTVLFAGRRWGKTFLAIHRIFRAIKKMPGMYWWVGLSWKSASMKRAWRLLKWCCRPYCLIREADKEIHFPDGVTQIWLRTAENEESLAGEGVHGLIFDEFTMARASAWYEQLRATLSDFLGWALFCGVPKGENWGYELFKFGPQIEGEDLIVNPKMILPVHKNYEDWISFRTPTSTNPFIDKSEIMNAKMTLPASLYKQEYECEVLSGANQVFSTDLIRKAMENNFDIFEGKLNLDSALPNGVIDTSDFFSK